MTLAEVKREIGKKLGDPDLKRYRGLVKTVFQDAIVNLIKAEDYTFEEISTLIKTVENSDVVNGASVPAGVNAYRILNITGANGAGDSRMIRMTPDDFDRVKVDSSYGNMTGEAFYYLVGNVIYLYPTDSELNILVQYIEEPDFDGWSDVTNVETDPEA